MDSGANPGGRPGLRSGMWSVVDFWADRHGKSAVLGIMRRLSLWEQQMKPEVIQVPFGLGRVV